VKESKLTFRIQEIPEGRSSRTITLEEGDLDLADVELVKADVDVDFEKSSHFIDASFSIEATMTVTCDRSLEPFEQRVEGHYQVLFKPQVDEAPEGEESTVKPFNLQELTLSIEQEVRDTILLELPVKRLHPRFLDEEGRPLEFETRSFGSSEEEGESGSAPVDPRWDALKKLKNSN